MSRGTRTDGRAPALRDAFLMSDAKFEEVLAASGPITEGEISREMDRLGHQH